MPTGTFSLYKPNAMTPLVDLYSLTMAQGYFLENRHEIPSVWNLFFRKNPFEGGFTVAAGLGSIVEAIENYRWTPKQIDYLRRLRLSDGSPRFREAFLVWLEALRFSGDVKAVLPGTLLFPLTPLIQLRVPLALGTLLEAAILCALDESRVATKAARMRLAAGDRPLAEMAARRAHGPDGAVSTALAAYIGGFDSTSNVIAGMLFDIPVVGSSAHAWVQAHATEEEAFARLFEFYGNDATHIVDTYNSARGIQRVLMVLEKLILGGSPIRVTSFRLDGGDFVYLSKFAKEQTAALATKLGVELKAKVGASGDMDEYTISQYVAQGAEIDWFGVGTALESGSLGQVDKLGAYMGPDGWVKTMKVMEDRPGQAPIPGEYDVVRGYSANGLMQADQLYLPEKGFATKGRLYHPVTGRPGKKIPEGVRWESILTPVYVDGKLILPLEELGARRSRERTLAQLKSIDPGALRLENPWEYPSGLNSELHFERERLMLEQLET